MKMLLILIQYYSPKIIEILNNTDVVDKPYTEQNGT